MESQKAQSLNSPLPPPYETPNWRENVQAVQEKVNKATEEYYTALDNAGEYMGKTGNSKTGKVESSHKRLQLLKPRQPQMLGFPHILKHFQNHQ